VLLRCSAMHLSHCRLPHHKQMSSAAAADAIPVFMIITRTCLNMIM
jgi:hypothetical protein